MRLLFEARRGQGASRQIWPVNLSFVLLVLACVLLPARLALAQDSSGISSPAPGAAISGDVPILGTAVIDPFQKYELSYKQEPSGDDAFIYFAGGTSPVINGQLGVWSAGGLPPGTYTIRLRVVKADGNYAEFFAPNLTVNQSAASVQLATATPSESPTPTPTFTPAPQPTPVLGQVAQPQVEGDAAPTPTPLTAPQANAPQPETQATEAGGLPTATPIGGLAAAVQTQTNTGGAGVTRELGEALSLERLRTQFMNGIRIAAAIFIGFGALILGKRLFEWVWRKYG